MDLLDRIREKINTVEQLPEPLQKGYLNDGESFVVYPLPGSRTIDEFMDGTKVQSMNFEVAMQSQSSQKIHDTLWFVQNKLEEINELQSNDGSFFFEELEVTNKPFINQINEQGWLVFLLDFTATITVIPK